MSNAENIEVLQLGLSGVVAEKFREIAGDPRSPLKLVGIASASDSNLIGRKLGETSLVHPSTLDYVPIVSLDDAEQIEAPVVFSGLRTEEAEHHELHLSEGRLLVTNASANRMKPYVALFNAYVGGGQLDELYGMSIPGRIVAGGNCIAIPTSMVVAPLNKALGVVSMKIETLQGWSGRGDTEVPAGMEREFPAIGGDEPEKIQEEPPKFLGSIREPADINIKAEPKRGTWVPGHHVKIEMRTAQSTSKEEVIELLGQVRAPEELRGLSYGKKAPKRRPLRLSKRSLLEHDNKHVLRLARTPKPMRADVHVRNVKDDGHTVRLEVASDNLVLGAAGSNVMNIMYARARGYI
jgi:aspartate-semialdehyde dehydrogenase